VKAAPGVKQAAESRADFSALLQSGPAVKDLLAVEGLSMVFGGLRPPNTPLKQGC
jgi:hypothetical protein